MDGQQSARVNIDDRDWIAFRIRAMRQQRSIADYLGELVRAELATPYDAEPDHDPTRDATDAPASEDEPRADDSRSEPATGERIRLSDVQLFTLNTDPQTQSASPNP